MSVKKERMGCCDGIELLRQLGFYPQTAWPVDD